MPMSFARKTSIALVVILSIIVIGVLLRPPPFPTTSPENVPKAGPEGSVLATSSNAAAVFQKAFWRRPAPDDKIIHAERREWTSPADGVRKWQWFIAFQPGIQTREWIASNPFGLMPVPPGFSLTSLEHRPAWFPAEAAGHEVRQNREGHLIWMQSPDRAMLHATDSGFGFAAPASKP